MGIRLVWDSPDRSVIRWDFDLSWNAGDFAHSVDAALAMIMMAQAPVHMIINQPRRPVDTRIFKQVKRLISALPATCTTVIVDESPVVRTMVETFGKINPRLRHQMLIADTLDEARDLLGVATVVAIA